MKRIFCGLLLLACFATAGNAAQITHHFRAKFDLQAVHGVMSEFPGYDPGILVVTTDNNPHNFNSGFGAVWDNILDNQAHHFQFSFQEVTQGDLTWVSCVVDGLACGTYQLPYFGQIGPADYRAAHFPDGLFLLEFIYDRTGGKFLMDSHNVTPRGYSEEFGELVAFDGSTLVFDILPAQVPLPASGLLLLPVLALFFRRARCCP